MMRRGPGVVRLTWWIAAVAASAACTKSGSAPASAPMPASAPGAPAVPVSTAAPQSPPWYELAPVAIDVDRLAAPALLAHIPADSPFALVAFEPIPLEYFAKLKRDMGPRLARIRDAIRELAKQDPQVRPLELFFEELDGKWNADGMALLGLSATPRFAAYGLGASVVVRLEVDPRALLGTLDRVARRAGTSLPPAQRRGDWQLWRVPRGGGRGVVIALGGGALVMATGPVRAIDDALPLILGEQQPAASMAGGKALKEMMARHRLGPTLVGFADMSWLASRLFAPEVGPPTAACTTVIADLAASAPRLVFGLDGLPGDRMIGGAVLELAPALAGELRKLKVVAPGLGAALAGEPAFLMGGAMDLPRAREAGREVASVVGNLGRACSMAGLEQAAFRLGSALTPPLPEPFGQITGAVFGSESLVSLAATSKGGEMPRDLDAFMVVTALDPKAIARVALDRAPTLRRLGLVLDGKLHKLELSLPVEVHAGAGARAVVLGLGAYGRRSAEQALGAALGQPAPLFAMTVDVNQAIAARRDRFPDLDADLPHDSDQLGERLGQLVAMDMMAARWEFTVDASDHGLVLRFAGDRK
jgi:hypothetical protein